MFIIMSRGYVSLPTLSSNSIGQGDPLQHLALRYTQAISGAYSPGTITVLDRPQRVTRVCECYAVARKPSSAGK